MYAKNCVSLGFPTTYTLATDPGSKLAVHLRRVVIRYMRDAGEDLDEEDFDEEDESPDVDEHPIPFHPLCREEYYTDFIDEVTNIFSLPTSAKKTTVTTIDTFPNKPVRQKGKEEEILPEGFSSCERAFATRPTCEILVTGDFVHGKLSNTVECAAEYDVNHQALQRLRQPRPAGSKAGYRSRDLDV
ncbi:hypothetical protein E4U16_005641 [Claviceps sp. LM84 group G4]|nr:hypothetical protein E4U16_005641 [Claviceps sp. LM84 group G4]